MERLLVKNADLSTKTFTLESNVVVIGRQPYCDVVLTNGAVSREHAKLTKTSRGWVIEDLQSRNGVWVNGRRIGDRRLLLANKDLIQLGEASLIFLSDSESAGRLSSSDGRAGSFPLQEGEFNEKSIVSQVFLNGSGSSLLVGSGKVRFDSPEEYNREIALLEERLRVMFDFARILGKAEDVVDLVPRLLTNLLRLFPKADSACVAAPDSNENSSDNASWKLVSFKRRDETNTEPFHASRAIVRYVVSKRSAILSESALNDLRFESSESVMRSHIVSVMASPIFDTVNDRLLGVIQIDSRTTSRRFDQNDLKLLVVIANQVAVYWENQNFRDALVEERVATREMQVANRVQRSFLPSEPPKIDGYDFFDFYRPAKYVGGDYFDYISLPDGKLAIVLGDVAGKGISASLLMAKFSSEVRHGFVFEKEGSAAMARLNRIFAENHWGDRFITLLMLILEPKAGIVRILNAGHPYPILSKPDGCVERIAVGFNSFPLGITAKAEYPEFVYRLQEGETISIMSDGISDATNERDEQFSELRICETLRNSSGEDATKLGRRLIAAIRKFAEPQPQTDDQTLVVFKRLENSECPDGPDSPE